MAKNVYGDKIVTPPGILTYFAFTEPKGMDDATDDQKKYSVELVFTPELFLTPAGLKGETDPSKKYDPKMLKLFGEIAKVASTAGFPAPNQPGGASIKRGMPRPVTDVEGLATVGFPAGSIFIRARSSRQPMLFANVLDASTNRPMHADPKSFYSGAKCVAVVQPCSFDTKGSKGVSLVLCSVQFKMDSTPLSLGGGDGGDLLAADTPTGSAQSAGGGVDDNVDPLAAYLG